MNKTTLTQFSIQHVSAMKTKSPKIPITRKEIEVGMKGFDCIDFNNCHRVITLNEVVQDPSRKDRVVIWCGQYEMDEDMALKAIKEYYKEALQRDIDRAEKLLVVAKDRYDNCDDMFMIRKGG